MRERTPTISPLDWALGRVGDRWTLLIVNALLDGPQRFNELSDVVTGVAPNILTKRLRALEAGGIVVAVRYQVRPPRFRYELTEAGHELGVALGVLASWGARHGDGHHGTDRFHAACGTPLETCLWCPTCDQVLPHDDDPLVWL